MKILKEYSGVVALVILAILNLAPAFAPQMFGAVGTRFPNGIAVGSGASVDTAGDFKVGANGSAIKELKASTCNLADSDVSHAASSTVAYTCAVTGVAIGDVVMAQLASSTVVGDRNYWNIVGAKATSAGTVTVLLFNGGAAAVPSVTSVGSSTNIWYMDN